MSTRAAATTACPEQGCLQLRAYGPTGLRLLASAPLRGASRPCTGQSAVAAVEL